jgi:hypothetical protein
VGLLARGHKLNKRFKLLGVAVHAEAKGGHTRVVKKLIRRLNSTS